jgi:hypothetical protein
MRSPVWNDPHRVEGKPLIASVENNLGADCGQTGKLAWRREWQINLAQTPSNWKITMALDI